MGVVFGEAPCKLLLRQ